MQLLAGCETTYYSFMLSLLCACVLEGEKIRDTVLLVD